MTRCGAEVVTPGVPFRADARQRSQMPIRLADMTNQELVMSMLAELSTTEISEAVQPGSMTEHEEVAKRGGGVAREARLKLEAETGKKVVSRQSARQLQQLNKTKKSD